MDLNLKVISKSWNYLTCVFIPGISRYSEGVQARYSEGSLLRIEHKVRYVIPNALIRVRVIGLMLGLGLQLGLGLGLGLRLGLDLGLGYGITNLMLYFNPVSHLSIKL